MKFVTLTDEQAAAQSADLWPEGTYDYEIREAREKTSSKDNDMTELEVWVYNQAGGRRLIFDYLVASEKAAWKIHAFAASCGLMEQYKTGSLQADDCVGRTGVCQVTIQKAKDGYPAKNTIRSYIKAKNDPQSAAEPARKARAPAGDDLDDSIPF